MNFRPTRSLLVTAIAILAAAAFITAFFPKQDFAVYYAAGKSLLSGRVDLYARDFANAGVMDYRYPPVFVLLFLPFALLPFTISAFLWAVFGLAAVVAAFKRIAALASETLQTHRLKLVLCLSVLFNAKYLLIALKYQNVHLIIVAAILISFCLLRKEKVGAAAAMMAVAISLKVFPLLLLPYFAIRQQWRFLGLTSAVVLGLVLLPAYYFGINGNIDLHQEWFSHVVRPSDFYELNGPPNLSIQGQTIRFLTAIDYEARVQDKAYSNVNFADIDPNTAKLIGYFLAGLVALITFAILFYSNRDLGSGDAKSGNDAIHQFGFVICMMLLVGPRTNIIYFIALFVPMLALLSSFFQRRSAILWIACAIAFFASVVVPLVPGAKMQRLFLVSGVDVFSTLAIWVALGWLLINKVRSVEPATPTHLP